MARALGANAQLLGKTEAVYGTAPGGNFARLPFVSSALGGEQGLIASDVIGQGRDPAAPSADVVKVEGDIVVPVDLRNFGWWLTWLLGAPTTTEVSTGVYEHEFHSGQKTLPSAALEVGMTDIGQYFLELGVMVNSMALTFARSGNANATFSCIAQGETRAGATVGGAATQAAFKRFSQFQGGIKKNGVALANITGAQLTYANNLEKAEVIRADGKIDGCDPGVAALTGSINARFADASLLTIAESGSAVELEFSYTISAAAALVITAHEVYLPKPKQPIQGPGGIQAAYNWQSAKNQALGRMMTVILTNDVAEYV